MPRVCKSAPGFIATLCMLLATVASAAERPVRLQELKTICVETQAHAHVAAAATNLQARLSRVSGREWQIAIGSPVEHAGAILLGRSLAGSSGLVDAKELEALKPDGFVIRASGNRIVLAGWDAAGTAYAAYELLRRLGWAFYPWLCGPGQTILEVAPPRLPDTVGPLSLTDQPFFAHRDLLTRWSPAVFGTTFRDLRLGDPKDGPDFALFGRDRKEGYSKYNYGREDHVDWWHTAAYLVPRDRCYESHPEYYALKAGERIAAAPYNRMQVCTSNPDVTRLSIERALAWIGYQQGRRLFAVNPADIMLCACADCRRQDPAPQYGADRVLQWVNAVARAVAEKHPEVTVATGAYSDYVKPPLRVKPEPNVQVWYAPWYWNSRADSSVSFDHPLNIVAMQELMGWLKWCRPGQIGVYDYPADKAFGAAERIKLYARHGIRSAYFNGADGDLLLWVGSRLAWNPFLDVEPLQDAFVRAYFGPAAGPISEYLRLKQAAIERHGFYTRNVFLSNKTSWEPPAVGPEYFNALRRLLQRAETSAQSADEGTRLRVAIAVCEALRPLLLTTHPGAAAPALRSADAVYRRDAEQFLRLSRFALAECERRQLAKARTDVREMIEATLAALGLAERPDRKNRKKEDPELVFDPNAADELLKAEPGGPAGIDTATAKVVSVRFDRPGETDRWLCDGSRAELISPVRMASVATPGGLLRGAQIVAPLSKLPVVPWGNVNVHAGRFYAERVFDPPLDTENCLFLELHLHATADVPMTLYAGALRADFNLHAGEQIVRIDLGTVQTAELSTGAWQRVSSLALDFYPQDLFHPHPPARDTTVTLLGFAAANRPPTPDRLPCRGQAVWLTQFRPNVPNELALPREHIGLFDRTKGGHDRSRHIREPFRTFTPHRAVSPVRAILCGSDPSALKLAQSLQRHLENVFGVRLSINPTELKPDPDIGNVVLIGREACLASGRASVDDLAYVGPGGFVINAWQGRIALCGSDAEGDAAAVTRYAEDHCTRFLAPGLSVTADMRNEWLHELYTLEKRWFAASPFVRELCLEGDSAARPAPPTAAEAVAALSLAGAIKDLARAGGHTVPADLLKQAEGSALARCVAGRLLRDPFADATRLVREYRQAALE